MKKGDKVRVVAPVIQGTVVERRFKPDDDIEYLVVWHEAGVDQQRWFDAGQIEAAASQEGSA